MAYIPGWDSITGAHWWSNFYFWASIIALILLGVTEVVSHRYGERKDELAAIEQSGAQRAHETEIATLHREEARLSGQAETAKAQIAVAMERVAAANERAATAEQKAAELNFLLEKMKTWRTIENPTLVADKLKVFSGTKFDAAIAENDTEITSLLDAIEGVLSAANWKEISWESESVMYTRSGKPSVGLRGATGVNILVEPGSESALRPVAIVLEKALNDAGVPALTRVMAEGILSGTPTENLDAIHIVVGKKTFPMR
jgi:hypothetical protein